MCSAVSSSEEITVRSCQKSDARFGDAHLIHCIHSADKSAVDTINNARKHNSLRPTFQTIKLTLLFSVANIVLHIPSHMASEWLFMYIVYFTS